MWTMRNKTNRLIPWALAAILLGFGCARRAALVRRPILSAQEILAGIRENGMGLVDFEGRASISIHTGDAKHNMKALVLFRRPDALKMELTGFMGMSLATMALQDGDFRIYLPMLNRVLEGRFDSERLRSITGVPFDLCNVRDILLGTSLLEGPWDFQASAGDARRGEYLLTAQTSNRKWKVWVDAARLLVAKEEAYDFDGNLVMRRSYGDYFEDDGVQIPRRIDIWRDDQKVQIRFTACDINSGLAASRFEMVVPEDAVRVPL